MSNSDWGAIPRQLAEDVSLTLKRKFNVQTGFKPSEWNNNIKALTPLPEKTVSGSVITFSDGADDVPLKSCEVNIAPNLDGVSSVDVVSAGKNVFDITTYPIIKKRYIRASDGYFAISTKDLRGATEDYIPCVSMRGKTWVINKPNQTSNTTGLSFYDENKAFLSSVLTYPSGTNGVFTVPNNAYYFRFTVDLSSADDTEIQIEAGTTATAYAPYVTPTTHTANLGRTIYGGEVDVVNGTGTDENGNDFTFTPVPILSRLGDNTLWGDGELSVIYRYVAGEPSFETVLSSNPLLELTGVSGTDVERSLWTYTATDNCKIKFHSNTQVRTNTGSNDGYFTVKKNDTVIVTTYANTSTTTQFPIPDIELESGDTVTIIGGFDNNHTSAYFDVYSTITILKLD